MVLQYIVGMALHDEMNRDRIVFRICDEILSEKLKLNVELTDDKAVTQVSQAKAVKQQQPLLRGGVKEYHMPQLDLDDKMLSLQTSQNAKGQSLNTLHPVVVKLLLNVGRDLH